MFFKKKDCSSLKDQPIIFSLKNLIFLTLISISSHLMAMDRMSPRNIRDSFKKEKKSTQKLKFKMSLPQLSDDPSVIFDLKTAKNHEPTLWSKLFSDDDYMSFEKLSEEDLRKRKKIHYDQREKDVVEKYLEKLITVSIDQTEIRQLRFELAVNLFDRELYEKSAKEFGSYVIYYPSDKYAEFASYMEILSLDLLRCDSTRDQSETKDLIHKAHLFLKNTKYNIYRPYIEQILISAYKDFVDSELLKINFYLKNGKVKAAEKIQEALTKEVDPYFNITLELKLLEKDINDVKNGKPYVAHIFTKDKKTISNSTKKGADRRLF